VNIRVTCKTCNRAPDKVFKQRNHTMCGVEVVVRCHGKRTELFVSDMRAHDVYTNGGDIELEVFTRPIMIIIDRDPGDEDPNEPIQGPTCQM